MESSHYENESNPRVSMSRSAIDDFSSPGLVLVSQSLTGDNYASKSRAMLIALSVKSKLGFTEGTINKPEGTDINLLNYWIRNNNVVISWILNSVYEEISASIIFV
ncbi:hypothetical protein Ddye_005534 [Dipteronia dyeriana]|uniref:Retrotransposon Copia-like N-terminal domain-containing protein n=1 Tax=Dipteronia dyeriana TaxID=168575 RepID=A0AAD9XH00_9ROSI|nr:hypothetical protein Ddye_005534 [Dipteronia dyeriana]